jgi:nucleoside-diphosphate-sugar epimerase
VRGKLAVVIGGRGFIGRHLVRNLADAGFHVRVVSRQAGASRDENVEEVRGDVADPPSMRAAVQDAAVVCSLSTGGGERWSDFERDIVNGARNVAQACLDAGVRRLVYASSIAALYLGDRTDIDENVGPDPKSEQRAYYSRAKAAAEALLMFMFHSQALPVVIVRPGVVVGPGGILSHSGFGYWPSDLACIGWGAGNNPVPLVLVQDVAYAMQLASVTAGIEGRVFNLVGDVRLSAREFVAILAARSRRRIQFHPRPIAGLWAIDVFKWVLKELARKPENFFPSYRDLQSRSLLAQFNCRSAKSILGWNPNNDLDVFLQQVIDCNLRPIAPGDLRLEQ